MNILYPAKIRTYTTTVFPGSHIDCNHLLKTTSNIVSLLTFQLAFNGELIMVRIVVDVVQFYPIVGIFVSLTAMPFAIQWVRCAWY